MFWDSAFLYMPVLVYASMLMLKVWSIRFKISISAFSAPPPPNVSIINNIFFAVSIMTVVCISFIL